LQWTNEAPFNTKAFRKALKRVHSDRNREAHYIKDASGNDKNNDSDAIVYDKLALMRDFLKDGHTALEITFEKYHKGFVAKMVMQLEKLLSQRPANLPEPTEEQREDYEDWFIGAQSLFS
jgi:hypothetical protein